MTKSWQQRAREGVAWARTERGATWAFRAILAFSVVVYAFIGRRQWFVRDDWGWVVSRNSIRQAQGWQEWLFSGQDGHWMTAPILIWRGIQNIFHLGSYWPYLISCMIWHVFAVLLARVLCRRLGVSAWTTTLVCALLLLFGSGWDNIVFAIQITYNMSIVAFLAQLLLIDHEGPADRRDYLGAGIGVIGVMSSGFGPIFLFGITAVLILRRRWKALAVAVVPQALAVLWWFTFWGGDAAADRVPGPRSQVPAYVAKGVTATFEALIAITSLGGIVLVGALIATLWRGRGWRAQSTLIALWATVLAMFAAIGLERIGFGVGTAASSRYLHVAAIVLAPAFAVAIDHLLKVSREALWAGRLMVVVSIVLNAGWLHTNAAQWAKESNQQRRLFELILGSGYVTQVDPNITPVEISPNVSIAWFGYLVSEHAIVPRAPANEAEIHLVRIALGLEQAPPPAAAP